MIRENDDNPPGDDPASAGLPDWLDFEMPPSADAPLSVAPLPWETAALTEALLEAPAALPWETAPAPRVEAPAPAPIRADAARPVAPAAPPKAAAPLTAVKPVAPVAACKPVENLSGLRLTLAGPARIPSGSKAEFLATIANQGKSAVSVDFHLRVTGGLVWSTTGQADRKQRSLGLLTPGQSRSFHLHVKSEHAGDAMLTAELSVGGLRVCKADAPVTMTQPALALRVVGPEQCLTGQAAEVRVEVANTGSAAARAVEVSCLIPDDLEYAWDKPFPGPQFTGGRFQWSLGAIEPGAVQSLLFMVRGNHPGDAAFRASALAADGVHASAKATTRFEWEDQASCAILDKLLAALDDEAAADPGAASPRDADRRAADVGERHLVFALGGADYAIPFQHVLEVSRPLAITPVPGLPDWMLGISNVRGDIVSMVQLRSFLGMDSGARDAGNRMVVVRSLKDDMTTGLVVDRVRGVRMVDPAKVRQPTAAIDDPVAPFLRGVAELDGRLLILLDLDQLLRSESMRQFELA